MCKNRIPHLVISTDGANGRCILVFLEVACVSDKAVVTALLSL